MYSMSKKPWPTQYSKLLYKLSQYFLDIQYNASIFVQSVSLFAKHFYIRETFLKNELIERIMMSNLTLNIESGP